MKSYDRLVLWVEYFNSELSRASGRRVPMSKAVRSPTLEEVAEAAKRARLDPQSFEASHPRLHRMKSGYVSVSRTKTKSVILKEVAASLAVVRGQRRREGQQRPGA